MRPQWPLLLLVTAVIGVAATTGSAPTVGPPGRPVTDHVLFEDDFSESYGPRGLVTNVYAHAHRFDPASVMSPLWQMTSGSLFSRDGRGWSGQPDLAPPDATSRQGSGSAVFRLRTRERDFGDVQVTMRVRVLRWVDVLPGSMHAVVIWTRYQNDRHLYLALVLSASGRVSVAKKVPGGPSPRNGGTYYGLPPLSSEARFPVVLGRWYDVGVRVCTGPDGTVTLDVLRDGRLVHSAVDVGPGGVVQVSDTGRLVRDDATPIRNPGRVGIRADNAEFEVERFEVRTFRACADRGRR